MRSTRESSFWCSAECWGPFADVLGRWGHSQSLLMCLWSDPCTQFWHLLLFLGLFRLSHETGCLHNTEPMELKIHFPERARIKIQPKTSFTPGLCRIWVRQLSQSWLQKFLSSSKWFLNRGKKSNILQISQPFCKDISQKSCVTGKILTQGFFPLAPKFRQLRKYSSHLTTTSSHLILFQITAD